MSEKLRYILVVFILVLTSFSTSSAFDKWENWSTIGIDKKIKNAELSLSNANFFRQDYGWFVNNTQITFDFFTHKTCFVGVGYKHEFLQLPNQWRKEYRPYFRFFYQKKIGNWKIEDRTQYELRFIEGELFNRIRNEISVAYTKSDKITPFFSTEFFVNLDNMRYNRQRIFVGAALPLGKLEFAAFVGPEINRFPTGKWRSKYILGTGLSYSF